MSEMGTVERILELINKKGITRNKMLRDLGLNANSFINWKERGTCPNGETLFKVAQYLDVTTDYLISGGDISADTPITDGQLKFALYGDAEIDDEILGAVKEFAEFQLNQMKKKTKGK